ncbi:capsule assembly protein Wzi [Dokdonia sp. Hel_I_63]|uniref:capsule assembly Wzi family protein n=1 Tax=Dokdonia sp. Hel_I_63 TaxID=1249996 RepID=UPI001199D872|nr:capsule assembly Wzi family protein [Dokdonia sp. Hel_I_63]TVZ23015.1 capsule assembly protein Wzi [Dokdonia sp. Hel_I_63]
MIKKLFSVLLYIFIFTSSITAQERLNFSGSLGSIGFIPNDRLPFWSFTNSQGFLSESSSYGVSAFAKADYSISNTHMLTLGAGAYISDGFDNNIRRSDLYLEYKNKWILVTAGAKQLTSEPYNLSTINNNILQTGNARPLPGIIISNRKSIKLSEKFSLDAALAHYNLNDDRSTKNSQIHYKMIRANWTINEVNSLSVALRHYVQWGGTLSDGTKLPSDLQAFGRIFIGANGGDIDNPNEAINALGNHLGSYNVNYKRKLNIGTLALYHQSLFEDRSGRELNNFPDGVWGINYLPEGSKLIKSILYEYIQTISQSGAPRPTEGLNQQSGGDNYFSNGIYPSGWTYEGAIIGLPFLNPFGNTTTPRNNRMIGHHLGIAGSIGKIDYAFKGSYIQNLGTYTSPIKPRQKALYSHAMFSYKTNTLGIINFYLGADYINDFSNATSIGIGYKYNLE